MSKIVKVVGIVVGIFAVLVGALMAWVYIPSPAFEPVTYEPVRPDYWPTEGFRVSTPEEQGMDSARLVEMVRAYEENHDKNPANAIDSITIVRNGYVVMDIYLDPLYPPDTKHVVHSAAKSIMSALVGIAIEQGYIESVDAPVVSFFEGADIELTDERMAEVTLKDLLTMQTGVRSRDSYIYEYAGLFDLMNSDDWMVRFLALPVDAEPGTRFDYSNLAYFMVSAIIEQTTGMDPVSYARENLFHPLGIEDVTWESNPQGIGLALAPMWVKPHDMLKFGLLYLQQGRWDGRQIVPADWVAASVTPQAYPRNYVDALDEDGNKDPNASMVALVSNKLLKPFADGYGYMWWLDRQGNYNALGTGGQYLIVAPEQNLVVMVTNSSSDTGVFFPGKLFYDYVLTAVVSDGAIAANQDAQHELAARREVAVLNQEPQAVPELPPMAREISGGHYTLEANDWNYDNFRLVFGPAMDRAEFSFTARVSNAASIQVGLDGVYRHTETDIGSFVAVGSWTSQTTFEIDYQQIGYSAPTHFTLTFDGADVVVEEVSVIGTSTYSGHRQ